MSEYNTGKWTAEEEEWFQKGVDEFGNDFGKLEEHMGGARSRKQIRWYYNHNVKKDPNFFSPKKRKASDAAASTPSKKSKAGGAAKTPPRSARRAPRAAPPSAARSPVRTPSKKAPPANESDEESTEEIKSPPPVRKTPAKKTTPAKSTPAPTRRSSRIAAKAAEESKGEEVKEQASLVSFFNTEEVQLMLAGIMGFVFVFVVKKFMA